MSRDQQDECPPTFLQVPLFPLNEAVLFPNQLMPLHIFEPRYRRMTEDALSGERLLVIAHILPGSDIPSSGNPPIAGVATVGRIVYDQRLDDGRYVIVLKGQARIRIDELPFVAPYRRGNLHTLLSADVPSGTEPDVLALDIIARRILAQAHAARPDVELELPGPARPELLVDTCCQHFVPGAVDRQALLEELNVQRRVERCLQILAEEYPDEPSMLN